MDLTLFPKLFKRLSYSAGNNRNSIHPSTHPFFHYPSFHREKLWLHPGRKQTKTVFAAVDSNVWKWVWCLWCSSVLSASGGSRRRTPGRRRGEQETVHEEKAQLKVWSLSVCVLSSPLLLVFSRHHCRPSSVASFRVSWKCEFLGVFFVFFPFFAILFFCLVSLDFPALIVVLIRTQILSLSVYLQSVPPLLHSVSPRKSNLQHVCIDLKKKITQLLCDWSCYKWKDSVTPCQIISHDGDRGKFDCTVFYSGGARGQSDFDIFGCANECATIGLSIPTVCLIRNISPARWNPTPRRHPCRRLHPSRSAWRSGPGGVGRVGCETDRPLCRGVF